MGDDKKKNEDLRPAAPQTADQLMEGLAGEVGMRVQRRSQMLSEAVGIQDPFVDEIDTVGESADHLFRRVGRQTFRDLSELKRERALRIVYWLYLGYPLAYRAIEIVSDFVAGEGITFKSEDPKVQEVLKAHWDDPVNNWSMKQHARIRELGLFGELHLPAFVSDQNGHVRLGYIDPALVSAVIPDPDNVEIARFLELKAEHPYASDAQADGSSALQSGGEVRISVIQPDDRPGSETQGRLEGDAFFFKINSVSNATRGNSDLLSVVDWIETHEQLLFGIHEAALLKTSVIWDVECEGMTAKEIEEFSEEFGTITKGMVRFHNEKVKINPKAPELGTQELNEHALMLKRHIATGIGIPVTWLSEGDAANLATAAEMSVPTTMRLRTRQRFFRDMITFIFNFVIDMAIKHRRLPKDVDRRFTVITPQIWVIDTSKITASMQAGAQSLMIAEMQGWLTNAQAGQVFRAIVDQLGLDTSTWSRETTEPSSDQATEQPMAGRKDGMGDAQRANLDRLGKLMANVKDAGNGDAS